MSILKWQTYRRFVMNSPDMFKTNTFSDPSGARLLICIEQPIRIERKWLADGEITSFFHNFWRFCALDHWGGRAMEQITKHPGLNSKTEMFHELLSSSARAACSSLYTELAVPTAVCHDESHHPISN